MLLKGSPMPLVEIQGKLVADPNEGWKQPELLIGWQCQGLERPFELVERNDFGFCHAAPH
jgi:hypothetical protein